MQEFQDGLRFAKMATEYDSANNVQRAIEYYNFAANLLENSALNMPMDRALACNTKADEYRKRAMQLAELGI